MTIDRFLATVPQEKRSDITALHTLIRRVAPSFEPAAYGKMFGYGKYHYRYGSGREGVAYRIAIASNASGLSLYVTAVDAGGWLVEQAADRLGKASCGKSCIRFKKLADLDVRVLERVLASAHKMKGPGEVAASRPTSTKAAAAKPKKIAKTSAAKKKTTKKSATP